MARNKAFEHLYGLYLYMHHHRIPLQEMADFEKEEWEKMGKDLEILEILKKHCDFSLWEDTLNIFAKEEYSIDYDDSVYTSISIPDEEDKKKIKEWLDGKQRT